MLGNILTNITDPCAEIAEARVRIKQAKLETGCGWVRHANGKMGWADLITRPDQGELLQFSEDMWNSATNCSGEFDEECNQIAWWSRQYGGTLDEDHFMRQIGRFDIYGPGAAGWDPVGPVDLMNRWTGDYFNFAGVFEYDVSEGLTIGLEPDEELIVDVWPRWVEETFCTYDLSREFDLACGEGQPNLLDAYFEKWMVFNEPFMRGLFPWNTMELFRLAKAKTIELQGSGPRSPVYIGGITGANAPASPVGPYARRKNPMSPLERHWALMCYGGGRQGDQYRTDAVAAHLHQSLGPESRFLSDAGEFSRDDYYGFLGACSSLFSLGKFWGLDPVRVMLDETTIKAEDIPPHHPVSNTAEAQANFVERTLLLALTTGYVDGLLVAWEDHCESPTKPADTPGYARSRLKSRKKPGFFGAGLIHTMLGADANQSDLAYESSFPLVDPLEPEHPLYCLRFRSELNPNLVTIAVWSAHTDFNNSYDRDQGYEVTLPVANQTPLTKAYRVPSSDEQDGVCNDTAWIPVSPGTYVDDDIQVPDINNEITFKVTGSPVYFQSTSNEVVAAEDWVEAKTLSGLSSTSRYDGSQSFQIDFHAEHHYTHENEITFEIPENWWPPQVSTEGEPPSKGEVTIHPVSRSLQEEDLEVTVDGNTITVTPSQDATILAGSQFSLVYGDSRTESTLLDMGPWLSGTVDLDFLKLENWMTRQAEFDYLEDNPFDMWPYLVVPRAGWGLAPSSEHVLGEDQRRVQNFGEYGHSATGIYRDFTAIVLYDDEPEHPHETEVPLHLTVTPDTEYILQLYLNEPDSDFEECDPQHEYDCKCFPFSPTKRLCLKPSIGQTVRVEFEGGPSPEFDSSKDRYFHFKTGPTEDEIQVVFRHDGDGQGLSETDPASWLWLDNLIFCYGLELRPRSLGGGPTSAGGPGEATIQVRVSRDGGWVTLPDPPVIDVGGSLGQYYVQPSLQ
ncbi:MAG: hypothetical protein CME06_16025 [Gemmatimonadetes bacterium]|nr:hypothetical protein [Gemmatimonadota bacterium]